MFRVPDQVQNLGGNTQFLIIFSKYDWLENFFKLTVTVLF